MSKNIIGVIEDGDTTWHLVPTAGFYDTLCGVDANDSVIGTYGSAEPKPGQKVSCPECAQMFKHIKSMRLGPNRFDV